MYLVWHLVAEVFRSYSAVGSGICGAARKATCENGVGSKKFLNKLPGKTKLDSEFV